jgi:alpha-amylase/alpha-mannosidase (GH57 family)
MVRLALLWHMHQPYYEDLASGEHILPWVRLHATKDYPGMVTLLSEFPRVRATFNLVPSLLVQINEFAAGSAHDPHLLIGLKAADSLDATERDYLVANGFHAPVDRVIRPHPRYAELYARRRQPDTFTAEDLRDLQLLHKLVWMDPDWLQRDPRLRELLAKGTSYSEEDKATLHAVELELIGSVVASYKAAAATGQVELSTSPFYHPILPLLCDSDVHFRAHPLSELPPKLFSYLDDARAQLARAIEFHTSTFGSPPRGVWPSEGAVSDEAVRLIAEQGCAWAASDEGILARSLGREVTPADLYRPYRVGTAEAGLTMLFRDHRLSDLIGFTYQSWEPEAAAEDFVGQLRDAGERFQPDAAGEEPTVAVILDGENAWEHYRGGGRPFLRALYERLQDAEDVTTVTMSEAVTAPARALPSLFPGSWINSDFYIWAGHRDDHRAWRQLAAARAAFGAAGPEIPDEARQRAWEELLIAEGSDWFWWYGDDHSSANDREFDDLFRRHLRNVYQALRIGTPDELHVTNISTMPPTGDRLKVARQASPPIDGLAHEAAWLGSAVLDEQRGAMHQAEARLAGRLRVILDARELYLRLDGAPLVAMLKAGESGLAVLVGDPERRRVSLQKDGTDGPRFTAVDVVTAAVPFADLSAQPGDRLCVAILVTNASDHIVEQCPEGDLLEVEVPGEGDPRARWVV